MSQFRPHKTVLALLALIVMATALAACGGGDDSTSSAAATDATTETSGGGDAATEAAEVVAPYIGQPSPFPVTEPLEKTPKGAEMVLIDGGTPVNALQWQLLGPAADTMGVELSRVTAGLSANSVSTAMDTVVARDPDAVLVNAIPFQLWSKQLREFQDQGTVVAAAGMVGGEEFGLGTVQGSGETYGGLMANYVIGEMNPEADVAVYTIPEVPVVDVIAEEFVEEYEQLCAECEVRTIDIAAATVGNKAPDTVVSDLQANPDTDVAVFASDEIQSGLPDALKAAGIEIETLGFAPTPTNLQYLKEGKETAVLAFDLAIGVWTQLDQAARELAGQELTGPEAEGVGVYQFLTPEDITFDPSKGWSGYPDFAERFAKLWGTAG